MAAESGIVWFDLNAFTTEFGQYGDRFMDALEVVGTGLAAEFESEAKTNAPWTDRSGDARGGLAGVAQRDGETMSIVLQHTVEYGIWLEVRWGGKYSIIMKTLEGNYARTMDAVRGMLS